jgi:hypothetical protein
VGVQGTGYRVNAPTVAAETVDGEVLMIHLDSGNYYSLRGVGAAIWTGIERGVPIPEITAAVRDRYHADDADELIDEFVAELAAEDLLATADATAHTPATTPVDASGWELPALDGAFAPPELEKFTDMQNLILLDPVHEVDAGQGWPIRRRDA